MVVRVPWLKLHAKTGGECNSGITDSKGKALCDEAVVEDRMRRGRGEER